MTAKIHEPIGKGYEDALLLVTQTIDKIMTGEDLAAEDLIIQVTQTGWRNDKTGQTEKHEISHVFIMTGADPNTDWLDGCIALDDKGFIKTGPELLPENLSATGWPSSQTTHLFSKA